MREEQTREQSGCGTAMGVMPLGFQGRLRVIVLCDLGER